MPFLIVAIFAFALLPLTMPLEGVSAAQIRRVVRTEKPKTVIKDGSNNYGVVQSGGWNHFRIGVLAVVAAAVFFILHITTSGDDMSPAHSPIDLHRPDDPLNRGRPLHLVCLHGYLSSTTLLERQLHLLGIEEPMIKITPLQGPHESREGYDESIKTIDGEVFHYWFNFGFRSPEAKQPKDASQYVLSDLLSIAKHEPVDGILGFSQGAAVATDVIAIITRWKMRSRHSCPDGVPLSSIRNLPNFAVLISAVCPESVIHNNDSDSMSSFPISCPSLHIVGEVDEYREESNGIANLYCQSMERLLLHPEGHDITPNVGIHVSADIQSWLQTVGRVASRLGQYEPNESIYVSDVESR